jgi:pimeloyl-ACP methyl ester carboxylesterase
LLILIVGVAATGHSGENVPLPAFPLPSDLSLRSPGPEVAKNLAAFAGAWGPGLWGGSLPHMLFVESVEPNGAASVVYVTGRAAVGANAPAATRLTGQISNGSLRLKLPSGAIATYRIARNGALQGRYASSGASPSYIELSRIEGGLSAVKRAAAGAIAPPWEEVVIPVRSKVGVAAGKTIRLRATVYRARFPGPQPLLIFNHGSAEGSVSVARQVNRAWAQALVFRALGYSVVVPMRKGYGGSDGPWLEESQDKSVAPEAQLDSAVEDLDGVLEFMKRQDYVDAARIVVAGQSRGGFLAVVYAARFPGKVAGAINFSGGWWGERVPSADFNLTQFRQAGKEVTTPVLWLYADHDSYYSLAYVEREFEAFQGGGKKGILFEDHELAGEGHFLSAWPERWEPPVADYLNKLRPAGARVEQQGVSHLH